MKLSGSIKQNLPKIPIEGDRRYGPDEVLLAAHDDLTQQADWAEIGFTVAPFLLDTIYQEFMTGVRDLFRRFFQQAGIKLPENVPMNQYHRLTNFDDEIHLAIVNQAKLLSTEDFPVALNWVEQRVSELCGVPVQAYNPHNGERVFHFRIIRPQRNDNNPLHRDVWLPEYHDAVNIYVPLAGSNELSSLTLVPKSHRWSEAVIERTVQGARVHGVQFNVPGITGSQNPLTIVRPNPAANEVLVFSPYLVHGGATNLNEDLTRISLEMRFWRAS
ncbi:MAG: hypothetical protein ACFB15_10070 [Cyclobacteriaceae bacterium]